MLSRTFLHITIGKHFWKRSLLGHPFWTFPTTRKIGAAKFPIKKKTSRHPRAPGSLSGGRRMISSKLLMSSRPSENPRKKNNIHLNMLPHCSVCSSPPCFHPKKNQTHMLHQCCLRVIPLIDLMLQIWVQFRMIFGKVSPAQQNATAALKDTLLQIMVWEIFNPGQAIHAGQDG